MKIKTTKKTKSLLFASLFTTLICVLAQISIPTPICSVTLQAFAVALCGYFFNYKLSFLVILSYILLGVVGAPVFSGFSGGIHHLLGPNGGFIFGFLPLALFCSFSKTKKSSFAKISFGVFGLFICYSFGIIYFLALTKTPFLNYFNLLFLILFFKDIFLCAVAFKISEILKKHIAQ